MASTAAKYLRDSPEPEQLAASRSSPAMERSSSSPKRVTMAATAPSSEGSDDGKSSRGGKTAGSSRGIRSGKSTSSDDHRSRVRSRAATLFQGLRKNKDKEVEDMEMEDVDPKRSYDKFTSLMNDSEERTQLENATINSLTLHFKDPALEASFAVHHATISLSQVRVATAVAEAVVILFFLVQLLDQSVTTEVIILNSIVVLLLGIFVGFTYSDLFLENMQSYLLAVFVCSGVLFSLISLFRQSVGIIFITLFIVFCFLVPRLRFVYASVLALLAVGTFEAVYYVLEIETQSVSEEVYIEHNLFIVVAIAMNMLAGYLGELYLRKDYLNQRRAALEHNKSEALLYAMLPHTVVEKMKSGATQTAEEVSNVTVLLSDVVGFTSLAASMKPADLVDLMDEVYSKFDALTDTHGVYKIETIGDAYMCVGGLPDPQEDHTARVVDMALDMQRVMAKLNFTRPMHAGEYPGETLKIRVGVHTGTVVAGVIGLRMPRYFLWGETVNYAEKMESNSVAGRVQLSKEAYNELMNCDRADDYELEERDFVPKGGSEPITTYLVVDQRPPVTPRDNDNGGRGAKQDTPSPKSVEGDDDDDKEGDADDAAVNLPGTVTSSESSSSRARGPSKPQIPQIVEPAQDE